MGLCLLNGEGDSQLTIDLTCHDDACEDKADGWGERAYAAALTVGKDLCTLSIPGKCEEKNFCLFEKIIVHLQP